MSESTTPTEATEEAPLSAWLIERIRFYDHVDPETVTADAPLAELGLDSIYVLTLCGDIEDAYGIAIDPPFFEGIGSLGELADALAPRISA